MDKNLKLVRVEEGGRHNFLKQKAVYLKGQDYPPEKIRYILYNFINYWNNDDQEILKDEADQLINWLYQIKVEDTFKVNRVIAPPIPEEKFSSLPYFEECRYWRHEGGIEGFNSVIAVTHNNVKSGYEFYNQFYKITQSKEHLTYVSNTSKGRTGGKWNNARDFVVYESDKLPLGVQLYMAFYEIPKRCPDLELRLVVYSGNKSFHCFFTKIDKEKITTYDLPMISYHFKCCHGDPSTIDTRGQLVRFPGGMSEGKTQKFMVVNQGQPAIRFI